MYDTSNAWNTSFIVSLSQKDNKMKSNKYKGQIRLGRTQKIYIDTDKTYTIYSNLFMVRIIYSIKFILEEIETLSVF